jgi:hypothetical protein
MRLGMNGFFLVFMAALFGYKFLLVGHGVVASNIFLTLFSTTTNFVQQSNSESEPVLPRAAVRDVVAGHDHDELDTGDNLRHGSSPWVST